MSDAAGPLGAVPASEGSPTDSSAPPSPGDEDYDEDEKMGSDAAVGTPGVSDFGLTPPVSPSLLDQTSFPEEEEVDDEGMAADKYLPDVSGLDTTADTTVDDDEEDELFGGHVQRGGSRSLSGHVIHEDSPLHDTEGVQQQAQLRPRPSPFARAMSVLR